MRCGHPYVTNEELLHLMHERSDQLWPVIYRIAQGVISRFYSSCDDPEELAQAAVERCLQKLYSYDPGRGTPFGFFTGICHVAVHDFLRKDRRQSLADFPERLRRVRQYKKGRCK